MYVLCHCLHLSLTSCVKIIYGCVRLVLTEVYDRFYGGPLQNLVIYLSMLTSRASSETKFSSPLRVYHIKHRPRPCLTYVHFRIHDKCLVHHFRLHALFIHTKEMILSPYLRLWMNLLVQRICPNRDGSFDILNSKFGSELKSRELIWFGFQGDCTTVATQNVTPKGAGRFLDIFFSGIHIFTSYGGC